MWLILFVLLTKNWIIFYKYKWTFFTMKSKWQSLINKKIIHDKNKQNWYIKNNKKYGNLCYIYKLCASFCFIGFSIWAILGCLVVLNNFNITLILIFAPILCITFSQPIMLLYGKHHQLMIHLIFIGKVKHTQNY